MTVESWVVAEDPRYPTLVVRGDGWTHGYSVNPKTGELTRVCICSAHDEYECLCGAWNENDD